ncbi:p-aminobenzoyl-glutamate hydrolase subunit A [Geofilum rubicundum JCM 15548]|uniref:p-aminobenzoyl-glutamate hydrolase subunit A n=2 Tax=Geofilum TaxID=1236988 RepID=A0A0E9LSU1_9BACT|nr:p-aminobenzoyl-glutamate hydrolase subunit A [Geofilum rubicundum JCM 15548]
MHAKAFEYLVKNDLLKCNVKFLIEGEEEIGSPNLPAFCEAHKEMLKADIILVSDTSIIAKDIPSVTTGLRGLAYWEVEVTGPNRDLHSGLFGGAVANPINVLAKMIAAMTDENNHITIPGFYDDVIEVSQEERALMAKAPYNEEAYKKAIDVAELSGEAGYTTNERTGIRPSFDVCGIWGGYTGEGAKTVLPSKAFAKISTRLVPNQDHEKIAEIFKSHFEKMAPASVQVKVTTLHGGQGYVCPIDIPAYQAAEKAYEKVYGQLPVPVRSGGSIPIISSFEDILGMKSVLMGFGLESDAIHSPNENFPVEQFLKGIEAISWFYHHYKG